MCVCKGEVGRIRVVVRVSVGKGRAKTGTNDSAGRNVLTRALTWYAASAGAGVMGRWPACSYVELIGFFINLAEVGYACSS